MASNRGIAYMGPGKVEVQSIDFPKLMLGKRKCEHGVVLKIVSTNICGSDQHMVRGRTTAPAGLVLGHELTGEVIEAGRDVEFIKVGDLVSVPFNIACGRCRNCKERARHLPECECVAAGRGLWLRRYGRMGRWPGRIRPGALRRLQSAEISGQGPGHGEDPRPDVSRIFCPQATRGYHRAVSAGVTTGSTVYVAGADRWGSPVPPPVNCWCRVRDCR